jgi:hypothetical protein
VRGLARRTVQLRGVQTPEIAADGQDRQRERACHESSTKIRTKSSFQDLTMVAALEVAEHRSGDRLRESSLP